MKLQDAKTFWRIMSSISLQAVRKEATRPVAVALVGTEDRRREVLRRLYPGRDPASSFPLVRTFASISGEDGFPSERGSYDIVLDAGGGWAATDANISVFSVEDLGGWEKTVERVLAEKPELRLALARRFPGLREPVARDIIGETALANAQFAMLNALPGVVPLLGLLLPTTAVGDMLLLAKNQAMMVYRLAACYGMPLDPRSRARDILPLVGNAFGWRALARELVGAVPAGVGVVARGAIAYAGTQAIGEAMRRLYATGESPTSAALKEFYRRSLDEARAAAQRLLERGNATERTRLGLPRWSRRP